MAETEASAPAEEVPSTPKKELAADSPSTRASTGTVSEPPSPVAAEPEAVAPKAAAATPSSAASTRVHTGASSTPLATPRSPRSGTRAQPPGPIGHSVLNVSTYKASPRYTFQPPARDMPRLKVPGPGAYEAPCSPRQASGLVTGRKVAKPPEETPGPGAHESPTSIGKGPKHRIGHPLPSKAADVPGPGQYEARGGLFGGPKYTVGVLRQGAKSEVPGPGAYEGGRCARQGAQYSIPCSPRQKGGLKCAEVPGPGAHDAKKTSVGEGPRYSHGLPQKKKVETTPGPGDYCGHLTTFHS